VNSSPTVGQVLRKAIGRSAEPELRLSPDQWKVVRALAACRTQAMGGQLFYCPDCKREHFVAHSCRNRHCPQCQGERALDWLARQESALLPVPYFHLVFTLPHLLNALMRQNRRLLLNLLFEAASQTLLEFGHKRLRARIGITAVLHTWSQNLLDHYHVHCIVTGGGLQEDGQGWVSTGKGYLFPVQALSAMFGGKFVAGLKRLKAEGRLQFHGQVLRLVCEGPWRDLLRQLTSKGWVVYAKRPFAGPQQVLRYLSRYTHRVAITNGRLVSADAGQVQFRYKDYADGGRIKEMRLVWREFIRRFCLHVLPEGFVKIRHFGLLGNRRRRQRLERVRAILGAAQEAPTQEPSPTPFNAQEEPRTSRSCCPWCRQPILILLGEVPPRTLDSS
jgi:hypothetical protein